MVVSILGPWKMLDYHAADTRVLLPGSYRTGSYRCPGSYRTGLAGPSSSCCRKPLVKDSSCIGFPCSFLAEI